MTIWKRIDDALTGSARDEARFRLAVITLLNRIYDRLENPSSAEQREEIARLQWLLDQYEQREEEEDVVENYEPKAVVVIEKEGKYEPTVKGPFASEQWAHEWANRYEPQAGEVVHVLETEQP